MQQAFNLYCLAGNWMRCSNLSEADNIRLFELFTINWAWHQWFESHRPLNPDRDYDYPYSTLFSHFKNSHNIEDMPQQYLWKAGTKFTKPRRDLILTAMGVCQDEEFTPRHLSNLFLPTEQQLGSSSALDVYPKMWITWNRKYEMEVIHEEPVIVPKYQRPATLKELHRDADPASREPLVFKAYKPRRIANQQQTSHPTYKPERELKSLFSVKYSQDSNTTVNVKGNVPIEIEVDPIASFLLKCMNNCESSGLSVHHYADVLFNQPHLMFAGTALETVQQLRHNSHPQFVFRSAEAHTPIQTTTCTYTASQ